MASSTAATRHAVLPQTGRRERHRTEIRERLFRSALRLFAERGYMETTVEDITEAADVGKGTFFNYFQTKEHVLATFGAERLASVERALERAKAGPVLPVLRELASDLAGHYTENPALLRAIYAAHASCAPVRAELHKRLQTGRRLLAGIFAIAQQRGEVRRDIPPTELARLTQVVLLGITLAWALHPDSSLGGTSQDAWDLFLPGIVADTKRKSAKNRRSARA
ncbi:MAG TPA: TetR/AcrR family transcriptional regulator [Candidatus Acidoferrales bacterium]